MGEMLAYYAAADVVIMGGSLLDFGGQNLIEACAVGRPVIVGPHTYNFSEASKGAIAAGAALRVRDAYEAMQAAALLAADTARREAMGEEGAGLRRGAPRRGGATRGVDRHRDDELNRGQTPVQLSPSVRFTSSTSVSVSVPAAALRRSVESR